MVTPSQGEGDVRSTIEGVKVMVILDTVIQRGGL